MGLGQPGWEQRGTNLAHLAAGSPLPLFSRQRRSAGVAGTPAQVLPQALPRIELETNVVPQLCFGALLPHTALSNNGAAKRKCSRMRNAEKKSERLALAYHTILYTILYYTIYYTVLKALSYYHWLALLCSGTGIFPSTQLVSDNLA